ncbi:MAG TPA: type II secretion system F family protein [Planctomycetota bacterium]|nr:type II secretion system F family protein [Planctomycetota bacterium]
MDERARWARLVAARLREGVPLSDALDEGRDATDSFELAGPLGVIAERVRRDVPLATALEEHPEVFTPEEISAVRACKSLEDLALALEAL